MADEPKWNKAPKPLNPVKLRDLALHYVGRYATSRKKLSDYLKRKLRERGWDGEQPADLDALITDFVRLGYIDDAAFAAARARTMAARGLGHRRVNEDLRAKGISEADAGDAQAESAAQKWQSAERFAQRKRIGPYATEPASEEQKRKQFAAFLRAGHDFEIARKFVKALPGEILEAD
ncbi:regulatory protein RecX [Sphingorhabdus pulchriflava]|uniref:Regulatory protein RecX n=1 Tax=Sphingorhabdus pulchriflava TaxID=2292257 RepID=A0A371BI41_9SPHN|nr:regulatory protein RecX [Sphingorhabdus pulchriflava]RDV07177.1 regulatory protein RecX [Sphingorhabdus pulchriflava]